MESLSDPDRLRGREGVEFLEETRPVDRETFETVRETADDHAAVGVTNDAGEVLLMNDGSHGWTLPAFAVDSGEDWAATARRGVEALVGVEVALERPERVRRLEFRPSGENVDPDRRTSMSDVVFRASPVSGRPSAAGSDDRRGATGDASADERGAIPELEGEGIETGWFDEVPAEQEGDLTDDIRLFVR